MTDTTDRDTNHEEWLRFRRMIADDYMRGLRNNDFPLSLAAEVIDDPGGPDLRDPQLQAVLNLLAAIVGQLGRIADALERQA